MSQDIPVFRSDAPHQVAVPQSGANAVSPSPAAGPGGPLRQITDSKVFAPLDEPRQLSDIEIPPDDPLWMERASTADPEGPAVDPALPAEPEPPAVRARRIRRLSRDLVERALDIRAETESISTVVDAVVASLPDFDASELASPEPVSSEPESNPNASNVKEST